MHGMSPSRPRGCVQANYQQLTPNSQLRIALCISCMIELKNCLGKGVGWICALNRWSGQERAQTSFCPLARPVLNYMAWELCRQIAAPILSRLKPFLLVGGVRKGVGGGGGAFWAGGPEFTRACQDFILTLPALTVESRRLAQNIISHFTAYIKFTLAGPGQNLTYPL